MDNISNSDLLGAVLKSLYSVAGRRTSKRYADDTIGAAIKTLEGKFDFFKYITINKQEGFGDDFGINVSSAIDTVDATRVGKAIETMIRVVYNDLDEEAGLYFITELKKSAGDKITSQIIERNVDLDQVQLEQHYAYRRRERKKFKAIGKGEQGGQDVNPLGYTWDNVASWKHEPDSMYCTLYNKKGEVIDRLNLDRIIKNYVERLSGYSSKPMSEFEHEVPIYEKEYELLKMLHMRDMDAETAAALLHISKEKLNDIIRKLSQMEMLQFISYDTVELTEEGISYLIKKEKKSKS